MLPVTAVPTTLVPTFKGLFGHKVHVGVRGADYTYETGTSMATPHVAGVAALVWSANRDLTAARVQDILYKTAKRLADPARPETAADFDPVFGSGPRAGQARRQHGAAISRSRRPHGQREDAGEATRHAPTRASTRAMASRFGSVHAST